MNKIYKSVWSKVRGAYVVVSEAAKNSGKGRSHVKLAVVGALLAIATQNAMADITVDVTGVEQTGVVGAGNISLSEDGNAGSGSNPANINNPINGSCRPRLPSQTVISCGFQSNFWYRKESPNG
jgi:hypothetical protein